MNNGPIQDIYRVFTDCGICKKPVNVCFKIIDDTGSNECWNKVGYERWIIAKPQSLHHFQDKPGKEDHCSNRIRSSIFNRKSKKNNIRNGISVMDIPRGFTGLKGGMTNGLLEMNLDPGHRETEDHGKHPPSNERMKLPEESENTSVKLVGLDPRPHVKQRKMLKQPEEITKATGTSLPTGEIPELTSLTSTSAREVSPDHAGFPKKEGVSVTFEQTNSGMEEENYVRLAGEIHSSPLNLDVKVGALRLFGQISVPKNSQLLLKHPEIFKTAKRYSINCTGNHHGKVIRDNTPRRNDGRVRKKSPGNLVFRLREVHSEERRWMSPALKGRRHRLQPGVIERALRQLHTSSPMGNLTYPQRCRAPEALLQLLTGPPGQALRKRLCEGRKEMEVSPQRYIEESEKDLVRSSEESPRESLELAELVVRYQRADQVLVPPPKDTEEAFVRGRYQFVLEEDFFHVNPRKEKNIFRRIAHFISKKARKCTVRKTSECHKESQDVQTLLQTSKTIIETSCV